MIDDPEDKKPADWDDVPKTIPDPDAKKPADWDDEDDGEWTAPEITNPQWKGEWRPRRMENPAYKVRLDPLLSPPAHSKRYTQQRLVAVDLSKGRQMIRL